MHALIRSRALPYRIARIGLLVLLGWFAVKNLVYAEVPTSLEWPHTDFKKRLVEMSEIQSGGPPKDGIPAIDQPRFVSVKKARAWLDPREPVIVVSVGNKTKAYPLQILIWHEIVNDKIGDLPISVTFCPLCNASIVFDRRQGGRVLDFGTTGRLRKSDLVMYDRQTESWWQQFTGRAIIGELAGTVLTRIPASIVAFEDLGTTYPHAQVLSRKTGYSRAYGKNPYRGYDSITDRPFLFFDPVDPRLPPMERVLNVAAGGAQRLYPFSVLRKQPVINDQVGGVPVVVFSREGTLSVLDAGSIAGSRTVPSATAFRRDLGKQTLGFELSSGYITDRETGSRWNLLGVAVGGPLKGTRLHTVASGVHFAFAWLAFNPNSQIYARPAGQ